MSTIREYKPVPFYFINTVDPYDLSRVAIMKSMKKLKWNGFGGCVVFNKPPDGFSREEYLSDKWFETIGGFAESGRKLKMQIWINDGFDFPPGDAGGRIQKLAPGLKQQRLVACGENDFEIKDVEWGFPAFEEPQSSELFIKLVYEEYYKRLGEYFGNGITGFFSDTDCRRINAHILDQLDGKPYFPWARNFAAEFEKKYSYRIEPHLPDIVRGKGKTSVLRDYWCFAGELYACWFRNNYQWCREHGVLYSFHSSDTGPFSLKDCPRSSSFAEGSFLYQASFCDYPGTDHELLALDGGTHYDSRYYVASASWGGSDVKARASDFNNTKWDLRAKYTASAAYLYRRKRALCEAFAATNWGATHQDLRRIAAWQVMQGINFFIPHAVHHRFHGETRYFAPPEFLAGSLRHGLKEFNDALAYMCFVASQGELIDPVVVLDSTEHIWQGKKHCLFDLCDKLNRMPLNYIIADENALRREPERFKTLILPGIDLDSALLKLLTDNGCAIFNASELEKLPLPDISFDGGDIHYMLRRLESGEEMLLASNIWSEDSLIGTLRFRGKAFDIELSPGEIAVFNGPFEKFRSAHNKTPCIKLPEKMRVKWWNDNIIPLPVSGIFTFYNSETLPDLYALVPEKVETEFDNMDTGVGVFCEFLGEKYRKITLQGSGIAGTHSLKIRNLEKTAFDMVYLCGDFDIKIETENDFFRKYMSFYNMELYMPEKLKVTLGLRSNSLRVGDWTKQGAPFYSGTVSYMTEIKHSGGRGRLVLGKINGTCAVKLNGKQLVKRIWEPYEYILNLKKGVNLLEITVSNTMANLLECYKAESGLMLSMEAPGKAILNKKPISKLSVVEF